MVLWFIRTVMPHEIRIMQRCCIRNYAEFMQRCCSRNYVELMHNAAIKTSTTHFFPIMFAAFRLLLGSEFLYKGVVL